MAFRLLRSRALSMALYRGSHCGSILRRSPRDAYVWSTQCQCWMASDRCAETSHLIRRGSILLRGCHSLATQAEILNFIKSTFDKPEGLNHRWLNNMNGKNESFDRDGVFLVLVDPCAKDSCLIGPHDCSSVLERIKLLQNRYPKLNIFGLQCCHSTESNALYSHIIQTIMEEYITFPILMSDMNFEEMTTGACYLLFEGSGDRLFHYKLDVELGSIVKGIEELDILNTGNTAMLQNSNGDRMKHLAVKEPHICSSLRNLLFYYPGCISVDEDGNRLFISDSNHHRIIITDVDGKILDCIGSSPGFEDGEFDSAKLLRPAASYYCEAEKCLYVVDSENHAIRRADMSRRVLETVYPVSSRKPSGIWSWISDKLGLTKEIDLKPEDFDTESINFPWHLLKLEENDFLVINRSFETSWIMNMSTGDIKETLKGVSNSMEICGNLVMERVSPLKDIFGSMLSQRFDPCLSLEGFPYAGLMSSIVNIQNYTVICDAGPRGISYFQLSELGVLGVPYWLVCPLERVLNSEHFRPGNEHIRNFSVLPGRCEIRVNIDIPKGTELAAPLDEGCIWRQARGSVAEVSGSDDVMSSTEKVGVAQQWFDELDNLAFSKSAMESDLHGEDHLQDRSFRDDKTVHFDCAVNISPGSSEVVISAVLYLKLKKSQDAWEEQNSQAMRILNLQKHGSLNSAEDACIKFLIEKCVDLHCVVFMKPLHLRLRLHCSDHPTAITDKETISTDSILEVNLSIN